jgi:hypothetical protein
VTPTPGKNSGGTRDSVRRGSVNDINFEEGDRVRVRLSATEFGVGTILAKPVIGQPLYVVEINGQNVEASWFHIHHHRDEELRA